MIRQSALAALALGSWLVSGLIAQETRLAPISPTTPIPPGATPVAPGTHVLPVVPVVPAPPTLVHPSIPNAVQPQFPPRSLGTTIPAPPGRIVQMPPREAYTGPIKVTLDDGTTLTGEIHAEGPLDCVASFGPIAVPFDKIRGILCREVSDGQGPQGLQAILALEHNDALTVTLSSPAIKMKTSWGDANIELHHVRSLLLTADKVHWAETPDGRRLLMPDSDAAPPLPPQ